jgi:hypothetical protein
MATSEIRTKPITAANFTCTVANLANNSARQTTLVANSNNYPAALVGVKLSSGTSAPTVGTVYEIYLIRSNVAAVGGVVDDNAGASDAAITIENAPLLGSLIVTATSNKAFSGVFDTAALGPLGPEWGIAVWNRSGQALHTTAGNHLLNYVYYVPEAQ